MRCTAGVLCLVAFASSASADEIAQLSPGDAAPAFTLQDTDGNSVSLASYTGKTVVLEWFNPGCPYVVHAHENGALQGQAARVVTDDVVWLAINSGAPGRQGHGVSTNQEAAQGWNIAHPILMDESGDIGRAYGARTTPAMVVVGVDGTVAYVGALDNAPMGTDPDEYLNYVDQALTDVSAGTDVRIGRTQSYGCSVKYGS